MGIGILNFKYRGNIATKLVDSLLTAEARTIPTEGHAIAFDPHTNPTEGHAMASDPHMKSPQRCKYFYQIIYPQDTRRSWHMYTKSYFEYDAFVRGYDGVN
jgi:hypothetical protein